MINLYNGDCLEHMRTLPTGSIDAVITDPPYTTEVKNDGSGKLNPWANRINTAIWYKEWIGEAKRILKPTGCLWAFFNWRSMVTFQKAADDLIWPLESILVWDKECIGAGGMRGLRPTYELIGLWAKENFHIPNRTIPDIKKVRWSAHKPHGHPAEKPVELIRWLIEISTKENALVYDPFMGSGTTGIACILTNRNFIGCEIDTSWYVAATKRIKMVTEQPNLINGE